MFPKLPSKPNPSSISHNQATSRLHKQFSESSCLNNPNQLQSSQEKLEAYRTKISNELQLNNKLKQLYKNIQDSTMMKNTMNEEEEELIKVNKEKKKYESQVRNQEHSLNVLIAENKRFNELVNKERSQRAIYFNIYKNLEHQIYSEETKYKHLLIEQLIIEESTNKIKEKFKKGKKHTIKQIEALNQQLTALTNPIIIEQCPHTVNNQQTHNHQINPKETSNIQNPSFDSEQIKYEIESKKTLTNNVIERLKLIGGFSTQQGVIDHFRTINIKVNEAYDRYLQKENQQKQLDDKVQELTLSIAKNQQKNQCDSDKIPAQIQPLNSTLLSYKEQLSVMQKELSEKIGIQVFKLTNEMVLHYSMRVSEEKPSILNKKISRVSDQKDKTIQKSSLRKKDQQQSTIFLTPKEMHARVLKMKLQ